MFIFVFSKMVLEQPDKFREEKMYLDFCLMKYTIINSRWILDSNTIQYKDSIKLLKDNRIFSGLWVNSDFLGHQKSLGKLGFIKIKNSRATIDIVKKKLKARWSEKKQKTNKNSYKSITERQK